jgi:uncharacterized membrane protein
MSLVLPGRLFFAIAIVAFGVQHLVHGAFVTRVVPWWPAWMPAHPLWAGAVGLALIGAGAAILANRRTAAVASVLGAALLLSFLCLGLPMAAADAPLGGAWTRAGKALALAGGAFLVAQTTGGTTAAGLARLWPLGPWCFGAFLALCGIQHFVHARFVQTLVPAWIPGALIWTWFTGVALLAAGVGVVLPRTARLAGLLTGLMIATWVVVLHVPRALADLQDTNETTAVFEALAMSGIGFLVAARAGRASLPVAASADHAPAIRRAGSIL